MERRTFKSELQASGTQLMETAGEVLHEGNVRRLHVVHDDRTVLHLPLTVIVVATILAPAVAVLSAILALVSGCKVGVERDPDPPADPQR